MNLNPIQKFYFSAAAIFIILIFFICVIFLLMGEIKDRAQAFTEGKKTLLVLEKEITEVKYFKKRHQELKNISSECETVFLDFAEILGFITSLERMADQTNNSLKIEGVSTLANDGFIKFQISLLGSFSNLFHFLTGLENVPYPPYRLVEVENIDLRKISDENIQTNLGIKVYTK
ncbi:MAG: hypothetical protein COV69_04150 [Parcubacteria group bacterium CG11_big_fil_rev_8_21_14_0_20_39_14]|nr:MAG: hypothetical protein COV69_04150 [Parcubacteria group bacterium CG11_big_fil_rev_8_21_14_0_20_39_14]PIS35126.1 MAG: hypothetical protein COT36_04210 [Parcubacteria group bacterium CG08_land_8_20_14_0_20_38_56]